MKNTKFKLSKIELVTIQRFFDNIKLLISITKKTNIFLKYRNKITISILVFFFLYLTYLSLPGLLNKKVLENNLKDRIFDEFKFKINTPSDISYSILPTPHFVIKNVTILNNNLKKYEGVFIEKFKVKISQKNLFTYKNFIIKELVLEENLIDTKKINFDIFMDFFSSRLSKKKINLYKTKIIYRDDNDETILIIPLKKIFLNYNELTNSNFLSSRGKLFNQFFDIKFEKQISDKEETNILFEFKNLNLKIQNKQYLNTKEIIGTNKLDFGKKEFNTKYLISKDQLIFNSSKKEIKNNNFSYKGTIDLKPFEFNVNFKNQKLRINEIIDNYYLFLEILRNKIVINRNFNGTIIFKINDISNSKILKKAKIRSVFFNELINFDNSTVDLANFGELKCVRCEVIYTNNFPEFYGEFFVSIKNKNSFYRFFQVPLRYRDEINKIFFSIKFNLDNEQIELLQIYFDKEMDDPENENILNELNLFLSKKNIFQNLNTFRNFVNKLFFNIKGV